MLFSGDEEGKKELSSLSRNELIALVNTAAQLAKSVGSVPGWRWLGERYTRMVDDAFIPETGTGMMMPCTRWLAY